MDKKSNFPAETLRLLPPGRLRLLFERFTRCRSYPKTATSPTGQEIALLAIELARGSHESPTERFSEAYEVVLAANKFLEQKAQEHALRSYANNLRSVTITFDEIIAPIASDAADERLSRSAAKTRGADEKGYKMQKPQGKKPTTLLGVTTIKGLVSAIKNAFEGAEAELILRKKSLNLNQCLKILQEQGKRATRQTEVARKARWSKAVQKK